MKYYTCNNCNTSIESSSAKLDLNYRCPVCDNNLYPSTSSSTYIENDSSKKYCRACESYFPRHLANCPICRRILLNN